MLAYAFAQHNVLVVHSNVISKCSGF